MIAAAQYFRDMFAKDTFVTDFAFSSYPEPFLNGVLDARDGRGAALAPSGSH